MQKTETVAFSNSVQGFYNILYLAGINAWIFYKEVTGKSMRNQDFLLHLATELRKPYLAALESTAHVHPRDVSANQTNPNKRRQWQLGKCKNNKTCDSCFHCKKLFAEAALHEWSVGVCASIVMLTMKRTNRRKRIGLGWVRRMGRMMTLPMS